jgi:DNA-binding transcriptional LysR family regulator
MNDSRLERQITLHQLRVFKSVVEHRGFTRGAQALFLSQPAVTHQMQTLAGAIGHPLFHPDRKRFALTPMGEALYERAGRILALVRETGEVIDDLAGLRTGSLQVAADTTVGIYVIPDALADFHQRYPFIKLRLEVANRARVRELLERGDADLGILGRLWKDQVLEAEPFMENSIMWFCAPTHPLVAREPLKPKALLEGPLLLREPGSGTRETAEAALRKHGVEPAAAMEIASNGALKRAVAGGLGVAAFSTWAVRLELALGLLHPLRVRGFPIKRTWHLVWLKERLLSPAGQAFRDHLRSPQWRKRIPLPTGGE